MSGFQLKDIEGDLFKAPNTCSLAHCVAADLKMGAGIAVKFKFVSMHDCNQSMNSKPTFFCRQIFGKVDQLKSQQVSSPGVAVLQDNNRYIYYLVTKSSSYSKPTYESLTASLEAMKKHCQENGVKKIAMPRIGCGLDGLEWDKVSGIIKQVFGDEDMEITIYTFTPK